MKPRDAMVAAWIARQKLQKLSTDEAAAELERAQTVFLESRKRERDVLQRQLKAKEK
jgi:hypothetical protein